MTLEKVLFLEEADYVKFFGVSEEDRATVDGKLYPILRNYNYIDEDGFLLDVVGWKYLPDSEYILYREVKEAEF